MERDDTAVIGHAMEADTSTIPRAVFRVAKGRGIEQAATGRGTIPISEHFPTAGQARVSAPRD